MQVQRFPAPNGEGDEQDGRNAEVVEQDPHGRFGFGELVRRDERERGENTRGEGDQRCRTVKHLRAGFDDHADSGETDQQTDPDRRLDGFAEPDEDDQRDE